MTVTADRLLNEYHARGQRPIEAVRLQLRGIGGLDGYNISHPVTDGPNVVLPVRVEPRDAENSNVVFFDKTPESDVWERSSRVTFELQDPFVAFINGELTLGGVQIEPNIEPPPPGEGQWRYRTILHRGPSLDSLAPFAAGPWGMKDIRLVELKDARVGVFTRPQGEVGGRGKIGFFIVGSLHEITTEAISAAPILEGMFIADEWGGVNDAVALDDWRIGVLGHIAKYDAAGDRHYLPIAFVLDIRDLTWTEPVLLFERADLGPGESKRPDLVDVVFPGGFIRGEETIEIYCGAGDAEAYRVVVPTPFD